MTNTLTYREALRAFADGRALEKKTCSGDWAAATYCGGFNLEFLDTPSPYRIRQATIKINGVEVPEPLREAPNNPNNAVPYWFPNIHYPDDTTESQWDGDKTDFTRLKRGLVHLTREAAEAHARALIHASGGKV